MKAMNNRDVDPWNLCRRQHRRHLTERQVELITFVIAIVVFVAIIMWANDIGIERMAG